MAPGAEIDSDDDSFAVQKKPVEPQAGHHAGKSLSRAAAQANSPVVARPKGTNAAGTSVEASASVASLSAPPTGPAAKSARTQELDSDDSDFEDALGGVGFTAMEEKTAGSTPVPVPEPEPHATSTEDSEAYLEAKAQVPAQNKPHSRREAALDALRAQAMERERSSESRLALLRHMPLGRPPSVPAVRQPVPLLDAAVISGPAAADCVLRLRRELARSIGSVSGQQHPAAAGGVHGADGIAVPCPRARTLAVIPGSPLCSTDILTEIMFPPGLSIHGLQIFGKPSPHDARKDFQRYMKLGSDAYRGKSTLTTVIPSSDGDFEAEAELWKQAHGAALGNLAPSWTPGAPDSASSLGDSHGSVQADAVYGTW